MKVWLSAGEVSGDRLGALLATELRGDRSGNPLGGPRRAADARCRSRPAWRRSALCPCGMEFGRAPSAFAGPGRHALASRRARLPARSLRRHRFARTEPFSAAAHAVPGYPHGPGLLLRSCGPGAIASFRSCPAWMPIPSTLSKAPPSKGPVRKCTGSAFLARVRRRRRRGRVGERLPSCLDRAHSGGLGTNRCSARRRDWPVFPWIP